ncbi:fungal-specific transcription factor-like protein [Chaetomium sp. MPI-CAGE-AT-0009]|nr:fungal-specific transcription factor-like protein [Chaetomium sp. MPI-CAGE-AT-0009]
MVEGESSLTAQSVFANDLFQKVASRDSRPEMRERIEALRHMVETLKKQPAAHEMKYPNAKLVPPTADEGYELPPMEATLQVLKLARSNKQLGVAWFFQLFGMDRFPELCLALHMAEEYNAAQFLTVNITLHFLFRAYGSLIPEKEEEYFRLSRLCSVNTETALSNLPLHLPATDDVIVALSFGAYYTIELAKPSLAWVLSSKASELCQSLGYHRSATFTNESPENAQYKQFLFWGVYTIDKGLALRLGRSSTIQDYDVTVPDPGVDAGPPVDDMPIGCFFGLWVILSRIHGQIYELLYCPDAIAQPDAIRKSRAQLLLDQLGELDDLTRDAAAKWDDVARATAGDDTTDFFLLSDLVLRLSTRTLIHRAPCIQTARETLSRHQECMAVVDRNAVGLFSTYMNWTILFAPFVPFIVLFCQVIEARDRTDLARLEGFVTSLQPHTAVSEAVDRLHRLFHVLHTVALQYLDSQAGAGRDDQQASTVDNCLAALGFPSQPGLVFQEAAYPTGGTADANDSAFQRGVNPMIWMGNGTELEDWFYNNEQMMHILEDGFPGGGGWGTS